MPSRSTGWPKTVETLALSPTVWPTRCSSSSASAARSCIPVVTFASFVAFGALLSVRRALGASTSLAGALSSVAPRGRPGEVISSVARIVTIRWWRRRPERSGWERVESATVEEGSAAAPSAHAGGLTASPGANLARASLALVTLFTVAATVSDVAKRSLLARIAKGEVVGAGEITASDNRQLTIGLIQLGLSLITAAFFIAWLYRANKNLSPLGAERLRFGTSWAIWSWIVPILSLFSSKQVVNDVWHGSDPLVADDREAWRNARRRRLRAERPRPLLPRLALESPGCPTPRWVRRSRPL